MSVRYKNRHRPLFAPVHERGIVASVARVGSCLWKSPTYSEYSTFKPTSLVVIPQLQELGRERNKLNLEKAELENTLEAEQEFIANRLQMQV
jgi:hypothetical protein